MTLIDFAKEKNGKTINKLTGPNGAFISIVCKDETSFTLPVGKKSQSASIAEMNILITDDGQAIATANLYTVEDTVSL